MAVIGGLRTARKAGAALVGTAAAVLVLAAPALAAAPQITEQLPLSADQSSATLRAKINPNGLPTTYRFEFGPAPSFGARIPSDHELFVGAGTEPVTVTASPGGLAQGVAYVFRVVATNADGTTTGPPQPFETLNACGLTQGRCFELVSPVDKGVSGEANVGVNFNVDPVARPALDGESFVYSMSYGLPDATNGGEVTYRASLGSERWDNAQLSPPLVERTEQDGIGSANSRHKFFAEDLSCAFLISSQNLTSEAVAEVALEAGRFNLYRRNQTGTYTLVTNLAPTNPTEESDEGSTMRVIGAAEDCGQVFFQSKYKFPGVDFSATGAGGNGLYEWDDGVLRGAGVIPGPSGPVVATTMQPGKGADTGFQGAVSADGSRLFFTAVSQVGGDATKNAIFMRQNGATAVDISQSQTAVDNSNNSDYQIASRDGEHVFFLGRYGLAQNGSSSGLTACTIANGNNLGGLGCDLYRYTVQGGVLRDISVDTNVADTEGASAAGVLAVTPDGSKVYFAARGQLVAGKGKTQAENKTAPASYNVYRWDAAAAGSGLSYVMNLPETEFKNNGGGLFASTGIAANSNAWATRVTPDGEHLLFKTRANLTGYSSGGVFEAYLYTASTGAIECISCRRDGKPSVSIGLQPFEASVAPQIDGSRRVRPAISSDGSRVFFRSMDALALGASEGLSNVYEWHDRQITLLATEPMSELDFIARAAFVGSSVDGDSAFVATKQSLLPQDTDGKSDIYVARVGGGFPYQPPGVPCDPLSEGGCAGTGSPAPVTPGAPASSAVREGNQVAQKKKKKKKKTAVKRGKKKKQGKRGKTRSAKTNGRAAK